jgi:hypothetical protein
MEGSFSKVIDALREWLSSFGLGKWSARTVKLLLVGIGIVFVLSLALAVSKRVEPSVSRVLNYVSPLPDKLSDVESQLLRIEASLEDLKRASAKCIASVPRVTPRRTSTTAPEAR